MITNSIEDETSAPAKELRAGVIPILDDETCKKPHVYGNEISEGMFCAGTLDEGVDACTGDSGGPLVCESDGEYSCVVGCMIALVLIFVSVSPGVHKLYGIISWGQHCGFTNKPGVYVKIAHYMDWIQENLKHSMINFGV